MLRAAIQRITNSDLSDSQWLQASLGVRRVTSFALPAFLAFAASTLSLQVAILSGSTCSDNKYFQSYLTTWSSSYGIPPETLPTKQPFWDRPALVADRAVVEARLNSPLQRASYLSASSPQSGDWLFAMPITSCGLRLDDEAVRVAVGLRLGLSLCIPHQCQCESLVTAHGMHGFICKKAPSRTFRHHALNDLVARAFASTAIPE